MDDSRNGVEPLRGNEAVKWMLIRGDRFLVALVILGVISALVFAGLMTFLPSLGSERTVWVFNGLVNGLLSLITIILTINQLTLSRQFGSPQDLYDRFQKRLDFRADVEDRTGSVMVPAQPSGFMRVLFRALRGRAQRLDDLEVGDEQLKRDVGDFADTVIQQSDEVTRELEEKPFEMAGLLAVLDYDDTWPFYVARRFQSVRGDDFDQEAIDLFDDVREILKQIDTARQYFKTLYLQRELAQLSRRIVVVGSLAIVVSSLTLFVYRNEWVTSVGQPTSYLVVTGLLALTLLPVAVLFSYALRLATVSRRTVVFGPFTPAEEQQIDSDWNV